VYASGEARLAGVHVGGERRVIRRQKCPGVARLLQTPAEPLLDFRAGQQSGLIMTLRASACIALLFALGLSSPGHAADMPLKAPPPAVTPWTGFYVGGQVGGAWASRDVSYAANDVPSAVLLGGLFGNPGEQPVFPNSFRSSGVVGGIEAGYNWQIRRDWLWGVEVDFSGSSVRGQGASTSAIQATPVFFPQTVSEQQNIDWYGTVRARFGWLPTDNLLLFATGGFAYGQTSNSATFAIGGVTGASVTGTLGGSSFMCLSGGSTCFAGASSSLKTGWTAGVGGEWMFAPRWSAKVEYQYVNLGNDSVTLTALAVALPGNALSRFTANLGQDDFHVARVGVNFHF
jgi:outer membrane immunogenic protein